MVAARARPAWLWALGGALAALLHTSPVMAVTCANAIVINPAALPIAGQALSCGTGNDLNSTNVPGGLCGGGGTANYKNGNEALYQFTPTITGNYDLTYSGQTWSAAMVYIGCPTLNNCLYASGTSGSTVNFTVALNAGTTYFIWFDTWPTPNSPCPGTFSFGPPAAAPGCGGLFLDPGGASANYPNGANQTTTICPDNPGDAVTLTFTAFNTEAGYDQLLIYDGPTTAAPLVGTYSGTALPPAISSTHSSGCLTLVFTSDGSVNYPGWAATITCGPWTPPPSACGTTVYDPGGVSGNYPNSADFTTTYCPDNPGDLVSLVFTSFNTEANWDFLYIYDGPNMGAPLLGTYSGTAMPPTFTSSHPSGCLTIRFTSDGSFNYSGWAAQVLCLTMPAGDCVYMLNMHDSNGNGWGSSAVRVRINGGPWTNYTVTGSSNSVLIGVNLGDLIELDYVATGPNQGQNSYSLSMLGQGPYFTATAPPVAGPSFSQIVDCGPAPAAPQDCVGGITICTSQNITHNSTGPGEVLDLNSSNQGCLSGGESMGTWYFFSPQTSGNIGFSITPANGTDDYDFAVWGPYTEAQCPTGPPLRCSWNAPPSYTVGLGNGATDDSEGAGGDGWVRTIDVLADQVYVMYIDNWSESGQAFTLSWDLSPGTSLDCTTLPVELLDLQATARTSVIDVTWATATEQNSDYFEVQRSPDNTAFTTIGTVEAAGDAQFRSDYLFPDTHPFAGPNYYRLKQVDRDGTSDLTHTVVAFMDHGAPGRPVIFPNPVTDVLNVMFRTPLDGSAVLFLQDAVGRQVAQSALVLLRGERTATLPTAGLARGWYHLRIALPDGTVQEGGGFLKQ